MPNMTTLMLLLFIAVGAELTPEELDIHEVWNITIGGGWYSGSYPKAGNRVQLPVLANDLQGNPLSYEEVITIAQSRGPNKVCRPKRVGPYLSVIEDKASYYPIDLYAVKWPAEDVECLTELQQKAEAQRKFQGDSRRVLSSTCKYANTISLTCDIAVSADCIRRSNNNEFKTKSGIDGSFTSWKESSAKSMTVANGVNRVQTKCRSSTIRYDKILISHISVANAEDTVSQRHELVVDNQNKEFSAAGSVTCQMQKICLDGLWTSYT